MPQRPAPAEPSLRRLRLACVAALVAFVLIIAVITMWPGPPAPGGQSWLREYLQRAHAHGLPRWISFGKIEFASNIVMFVPLGLCGALALARHRWLVVPAAALASATIETIQLVALPARYATVRDVVANTTGALIGYLLALATLAYLRRRARARSSVQQPPLSAPIGTVSAHSTAAHPTAAHPTAGHPTAGRPTGPTRPR
ncbi:MAG: VanZ family protein [Nakamurella multipartita]|jgi:hypothetical protein